MFELTRHLTGSGAKTPEIRFEWDDWNTEAVEERPDDPLVEGLRRVSDRAILALAIGMAEWVAYRFEPLTDDRTPWQFLGAVWAAGVDWRYLSETWDSQTGEEDWSGPVRGALKASMMAIDEVVYSARLGGNVTNGARWVSNIATHVLPTAEPFREWRDRTLERLAVLYPRHEDDLIGEVVPREVLDLEREFRVSETEVLINHFLRSLDHNGNPFLALPEELLQDGFTGTPYVFDILTDRRERL
jgi:hypothetical protein